MRAGAGDGHVHAINACYQRRKGKDDGDGGEPFQHIVHVVIDDAGEGIQGAAEDVGIDIGHFKGLGHVYRQVIQKLFFLVGETQEIGPDKLEQQHFIASERRYEIDHAFLDPHQLQQLFVPIGRVQLLFHQIAALIDLLQVFQIGLRDLLDDLQDHHVLFIRVPVLESVEEFFDGAVLKGIHRHDLVMRKDDADRYGYIISIALIKGVVFRRGLDDDELYIVLFLEAGPFVDVERVGEEIQGDIQRFRQVSKLLLLQGRQNVDPGAVLGTLDLYGLMIDVLKKLDHF